jgi:hypothetical protein
MEKVLRNPIEKDTKNRNVYLLNHENGLFLLNFFANGRNTKSCETSLLDDRKK